MNAKLIIREGDAERAVELSAPMVEIGRAPDIAVAIQDARSSRKHCRLTQTAQGWLLEDLQSRNGTMMNGAPVHKSLIRSGEEFRIGATRLRLEIAAAGDPATPQPEPAEKPGVRPPERAADGPARRTAHPAASSPGHPPAPPPAPVAATASATACAKPLAHLECLEGVLAGQRFALDPLPFGMGRKKDNALVVDDSRASGHHARIVERSGRLHLDDLGSTNGTLLNQKRVQGGVLSGGAQVRIGDTVFRVDLPPALDPGESAGGADEGPPGDGVVAEDDFARFDARVLIETGDRSSSLIAAGGVLAVLGLLLYFAVDVTLKVVQRRQPDPPRSGNLVSNWSFEETDAKGAVPGWSIAEGDSGSLSLVGEGAQPPGLRALRLAASDGERTRAWSAAEIALEPEKSYLLSASVRNQGAFAAGVAVTWLGERAGQRVEVGCNWGDILSSDQSGLGFSHSVRPPAGAVSARVTLAVLSGGGTLGSAIFDQVSFAVEDGAADGGAPQPAGEPDAAPGFNEEVDDIAAAFPFPMEAGTAAVAAMADAPPPGPPIGLVVGTDGAIWDLRRGSRTVLNSAWLALPNDLDPLALGYRARFAPREADDRNGVVFSAQLPDLKNGAWVSLDGSLQTQGESIQADFHIGGRAAAASPDRLAVYLEVGPLTREIIALGGDLPGPATFPPDRPVEARVDELMFGVGKEGLAMFFSPSVILRARPHPEANGRTLLVAEAHLGAQGGPQARGGAPRSLSIWISPHSRRENEAAAGLLEAAAQAHREGKSQAARRKIADLRGRFPWRGPDLNRAKAMEKAWDEEAMRALQEIISGLDDLKVSPSPVIRDALVKRIDALAVRSQGSPAEKGLQECREIVRGLVPSAGGGAKLPPPAEILKAADLHLKRGRIGHAELLLSFASSGPLGGDDARIAAHLEGLIRIHRQRQAETEVR